MELGLILKKVYSIARLVNSVLVVCVAFLLGSITTESLAGGCLKDSRQIRLDKQNSTKLSDYLCRPEAYPQARIRVQFQRLHGLAPGALLNSGSAPWVRSFYGTYRVLGNEVLREY